MPTFMVAFIVVIALYISPVIAAPWTNVTCIAEDWSVNSRNQSPCLIAAYLCAACKSNNTCRIYPIRGSNGYSISAASLTGCVCNSVVWNLLSACTLCQRKSPATWAQWTAQCPANITSIGKYPAPIPTDVTVPSWAYYDFTTTNVFDPVIASQHSGPESSAIYGATNTIVPTPSPISTEGDVNHTSTAEPSSNTGAIIGGVVGGVLGIGLIISIAFVLTRKRKSEAPTTKYIGTSPEHPMTAQFNPATPITEVSAYQLSPQLAQTSEFKPYDPNDSSTFPTGPNGHHIESITYSYQPHAGPGQQQYPSARQA